MKYKSGLATQVKRPKDMDDRTAPVYGLCVHQTGSGIVDLAVKLGIDPLEKAVSYYLDPDSYSAHYVVGYDGEIVQLSYENEKCSHIGFKDRAVYLSGEWETKVAKEVADMWKIKWPTFKTPAHLFPGPSPNSVFIGMELLPITKDVDAEPMFPNSRYTLAQHQAVVMLAKDIAERHGFPKGWHRTPRLLGHEDISPITRSTKKPPGGWDPGYLRGPNYWFDFDWVREQLDG